MHAQEFEDVLRAARTGGAWALTRMYEELAPAVTGYLRQAGADEPDDVASETFLDVFRNLPNFEGDAEGFRSWVFTIAHHRLVDERRRRSRRPAVTALDRASGVADPTAAADRKVMDAARWAELERHLGVMTSMQRDVVLLRVVAGLSVVETAEVVGRSEDAVRQLQYRGLRALEEQLDAARHGRGQQD